MKLINSNGEPSQYGLACGYIGEREGGSIRVTLYRDHDCYHVRAHEFGGRGRLAWDSFHLGALGAARARFRALARELIARPR